MPVKCTPRPRPVVEEPMVLNMRSKSEIQDAHDLLSSILIDKEMQQDIRLSDEHKSFMKTVSLVFCWVLNHKHHNEGVGYLDDFLLALTKAIESAGYVACDKDGVPIA